MVDRRRVLKVVAGCAGAGAVVAAAVPSAALVASGRGDRDLPDAPRDEGGWTTVARLEQLERGVPTQVAVEGQERDAWSVSARRRVGSAWLVRGEGDEVRAFSAVCPHLGCLIERRGSEFFCACHVSRFGPGGAALSGPSPRGLDPLPVRVERGAVAIQWKRFRLGTAERVEEG